jgi:hypothetical protein
MIDENAVGSGFRITEIGFVSGVPAALEHGQRLAQSLTVAGR